MGNEKKRRSPAVAHIKRELQDELGGGHRELGDEVGDRARPRVLAGTFSQHDLTGWSAQQPTSDFGLEFFRTRLRTVGPIGGRQTTRSGYQPLPQTKAES